MGGPVAVMLALCGTSALPIPVTLGAPPVCSATPMAGALSVCLGAYQTAVYAGAVLHDATSVCLAMSQLRDCACHSFSGCDARTRAEQDMLVLAAVGGECGSTTFNLLQGQNDLCAHRVELMCGTRGGVQLSDPRFCNGAAGLRPPRAVMLLVLLLVITLLMTVGRR